MELKEFFQEYDIEFWESGKNVSKGWINVQCPFCNDDSNHLGIRLKDLTVNCWKCGKKNIIRLIKELLSCSYSEAKDIFKRLETTEATRIIDETENIRLSQAENYVKIPEDASRVFPKMHRDYLKERGFDYRKLIRKYKIKAVFNSGKYAFRIIIPIYIGGQLISFTSRDVTGYANLRYKHASLSECAIRPKDLIYGVDDIQVGGDAILVEGVFDAWRLGKGAICSFGTQLSGKQYVELSKLDLDHLFILFDQDRGGIRSAKTLSKNVAPLARNVETIRLPKFDGDPAELSKEEADLLMRSLNLKG